MNSRICAWDRPQLGNDFLECVLFWKHVKKICPSADDILNPIRVQEVLEPDPVNMTISLHFESKIAYVAEAKAAMPP